MNNRLSAKEAAGIFSRSPLFSLIYHQNPDGDCLGSCLALYYWLKKGGKQVEIIDDQGLIPKAYQKEFIGLPIVTSDKASNKSLLVLLDCAEGKRTTIQEPDKFFATREVLVIDHHRSAEKTVFSAWIQTNAAATGEMLAELFHEIPEWKNDASSRFCFMAIASDTNFFRYSNTTRKTLHTAADLDQDPSEIDQSYFQNATLVDTILLGAVLQRTSLEKNILYTWITAEEFHALQVNEKSSEILEHLQKIHGEHLILLFKEVADERWRVSLRQKGLKVDLSHFAEKFAGGGHRDAAAFAIRGSWEHVKKTVFSAWKGAYDA